jgi:hypothetical protein
MIVRDTCRPFNDVHFLCAFLSSSIHILINEPIGNSYVAQEMYFPDGDAMSDVQEEEHEVRDCDLIQVRTYGRLISVLVN